MAEGRGFEPPVALRLRLISSQVPLTTQPPFHRRFTMLQIVAQEKHFLGGWGWAIFDQVAGTGVTATSQISGEGGKSGFAR